jgi:hypothetical protein
MSYLESGEILSVMSLFTYSCHGVRPAEVQKPQVLTGFRVIMIVQRNPPSTMTIRCICEAEKDARRPINARSAGSLFSIFT